MGSTPAYAAPEVFIGDPEQISFASDIWSLTASLFHLATGKFPFQSDTPIIASINITNIQTAAPDIRDIAPYLSPEFAAIIAKGLEKDRSKRFHAVDEMAMTLHGCLVKLKKASYSAYILYRPKPSDEFVATLLYSLLNCTSTPKGNRVFVSMASSTHTGTNSGDQDGVSLQLLDSLLVIPLISDAMLKPMRELKGCNDDQQDNMLAELLLTQILQKKVFPVTFKMTHPQKAMENLASRVSFPTVMSVENFLLQNASALKLTGAVNLKVAQTLKTQTVKETVHKLCPLFPLDEFETKSEEMSLEAYASLKSDFSESEIYLQLKSIVEKPECRLIFKEEDIFTWYIKLKPVVYKLYNLIDEIQFSGQNS
jgi:serine/threonine protein kinase